MIKKLRIKLKQCFRQTLHIIICVQLCFVPHYSMSAPDDSNQNNESSSDLRDSGNEIQSVLDQVRSEIHLRNPEAVEKLDAIVELGEAIEKGEVNEYLEKYPRALHERDHLLLANQKAESLEYHIDAKNGGVVEKISQTMELNNYGGIPISVIFKSIHVRYDEESKEVIFEGVSSDTVLLRQRIPDMDIIDYVHDKEFLFLLDRKKGLLLVDMFFARAYLGMAPIPFFRYPVPVLQRLETEFASTSSSIRESSISMEFVNRSVHPPDVVKENVQNVDKNFKKDLLFNAGDFMISYTDQNNQKHLVQFFKRKEIAELAALYYEVIDIMTKVVAPHLMKSGDFEALSKKMNKVMKKGPDTLLDYILSSLFTKNAVYKLAQAAEVVEKRASQLKDLSPRDKMLFQEWKMFFDKISSKLKSQDPLKQKVEGNILNTKEIVDLYKKEEEENQKNKKIRAKSLRIMANIVSKHKVSMTAAGVGILGGGFLFPEEFIRLVNEFFPLINNLNYRSGFTSYWTTIAPHLATMWLFFPALIFSLSLSYPVIVKGLTAVAPKTLPFAGQVLHPKGWLKDHYEKWVKNMNVFQRIVGTGTKIFAYGIYPAFNYPFVWAGQSHLLSAVRKGLNPFKKIQPDSDIGETAQIEKPTKLGSKGIKPQWKWKDNGEFNQHQKLQNIAYEKEQRMKSVAWLMASLAVSGKMQVNPEEILIYGISSINVDELKRVHNDRKLSAETIWVMRHLLKEIRKLDEMDIRKALVELDPRIIIKYYERAKKLAEEVHRHPEFRNRVRNILSSESLYSLLRKVSNVNKVQHDMMKNVPTDFVTKRVSLETALDHSITVLLPILTTERAKFLVENMNQFTINENTAFWSGKPHLNEILINLYGAFGIVSAQQTMVFTKPTGVIDRLHSDLHSGETPVYEPAERYTKEIGSYHQNELTYYREQLAYLGSAGKEGNLGDIMWRSYIARLRSIQLTIGLMVVSRLVATPQPFTEAVLGFFLYHLAGQWMFGWPWDIIHGGAKLNTDHLAENQKKMEDLKLKLSKVARGVHEDEENLRKEYKEAVIEMNQLYNKGSLKKRFLKNIQKANPRLGLYLKNYDTYPLEDLLISDSMEEMRLTSEKLIDLLAEFPPLPNKVNQWADILLTSVFGALLTTYLFVTLSVWSFDSRHLNLYNIGKWALINYALYGFFKLAYSKDIKGHWNSIKEVKKNWGSIEGLKRNWKTAKSWKSYYYEGILDLSRDLKQSIGNTCRMAFPKRQK